MAQEQIAGLDCKKLTLGAGQSTTCTVEMTRRVTAATVVSLSSSSGVLSVPPQVTVQAGSSSAAFTARAGYTSVPVDVTLTAILPGSSAHRVIRVLAAALPKVKAPSHVGASVSAPVRFSISAEDPQGLPTSLSVAGLPTGASYDRTTEEFTWTPGEGQDGEFTVSATAANSAGATSTEEIRIRVLKDKASVATIRNSADLSSDSFCSPGSWASLFGVAFTTLDPVVAAEVPLPARLGGVEVRINDSPVPHLFVSESQINFQCPRLPQPWVHRPGVAYIESELQVTVRAETGVTTAPFTGIMREAAPGLFTVDASGSGQGAVLIAGSYELAGPRNGAFPGRPARGGEYLAIFANGLGEAEEEVPVGSPAPLDRVIRLRNTVRVMLGGVPVEPEFAGLAPGAVGLNQINVRVPEGTPAGPAVPLRVEVVQSNGTIVSSNQVTVAIE